MLSTSPSNSRPGIASTVDVGFFPSATRSISVSLRLADDPAARCPPRSRAAAGPRWRSMPTSNDLRPTLPSVGAVIFVYSRLSFAEATCACGGFQLVLQRLELCLGGIEALLRGGALVEEIERATVVDLRPAHLRLKRTALALELVVLRPGNRRAGSRQGAGRL